MMFTMRIIPFILWSVGGVGTAAFIGQAEGIIPSPIGEWTALGCVCFLVLWLSTKTIPQIVRDARDTAIIASDSARVATEIATREAREATARVAEVHKEVLASMHAEHINSLDRRDETLVKLSDAIHTLSMNCVLAKQHHNADDKS